MLQTTSVTTKHCHNNSKNYQDMASKKVLIQILVKSLFKSHFLGSKLDKILAEFGTFLPKKGPPKKLFEAKLIQNNQNDQNKNNGCNSSF